MSSVARQDEYTAETGLKFFACNRSIYLAKILVWLGSLKFLYFRQVVVSAKYLFGEKSVRQTVRSTKCAFDKVSFGKMSVWQNVFRQGVFR